MLSSDKNVETFAQLIETLKHYLGLQAEYSFILVAAIHLLAFFMVIHYRKNWIEKPIVRFLADLLLSK